MKLASEYQKVIYIFHLHPGGTYTKRISNDPEQRAVSQTAIGVGSGNAEYETRYFVPWPSSADYKNYIRRKRKQAFPELIGSFVFGFGDGKGPVYANQVYFCDENTIKGFDFSPVNVKHVMISFSA